VDGAGRDLETHPARMQRDVNRSARRQRRAAALLGLALALLPAGAGAQLRPLEAAPWRIFEAGRTVTAGAGMAVYHRQRASLAGTEGRLLELGNFQAAWRSGRIAVEAAGTVYRSLREDRALIAPYEGVEPRDGSRRADAGDYRVSTTVLLTPADAPAQAVVRFGTRLPTTDNSVGLERDRTDFYALLGGRLRRGALAAAGEAGVGIYGTRSPNHEQSDAIVYALSAEYALGRVTPTLALLGHADPFDAWTPRGNEDLAELRAGVRVGGRYWVEAQWVRGLAEFSPRSGLVLSAGTER